MRPVAPFIKCVVASTAGSLSYVIAVRPLFVGPLVCTGTGACESISNGMFVLQVAANVTVSESCVVRERFSSGEFEPAPPLNWISVQLAPPFNPSTTPKSIFDENEVRPAAGVPSTASVAETSTEPKPFVWTADPDKIIAAVKRG